MKGIERKDEISNMMDFENKLSGKQVFINKIAADCLDRKFENIESRNFDMPNKGAGLYDCIDVVAFKGEYMLVIQCLSYNLKKGHDEYEITKKNLTEAKKYYKQKNPDKKVFAMKANSIGGFIYYFN